LEHDGVDVPMEDRRCRCLRLDVCTVQVGVDIQDRDHALFVRHSDVVELDVDVLRPLLVERVLDQVDGALVILVDRRRLILRLVEEVRQLT